MNKYVLLLLSVIITSCSYYSPIYWGWSEWTEQETATLGENGVSRFDWSKLPGVISSIDGAIIGKGYKKAKLLPGKHLIEFAYYPAQFGMHPRGLMELELKAGHNYEFRIKLCFSCNPRRYTLLVRDKLNNEILLKEVIDKEPY